MATLEASAQNTQIAARRKSPSRDGGKMKNYKAVIFDMDGVIFDSESLCLRCWEQTAKEKGIPGMHETFFLSIGVTTARTRGIFAQRYGEDFDYDAFMTQASALFHKIADENGLPIKPGVREILTALRQAGLKIGLASSTRQKTVEKELQDADLYRYFDSIVGGDSLNKSKPDPDIYLLACERIGVRPKDACAIEDSYNGIRSAYSAGMQAIMVPDLLVPDEEMRSKSVYIARDLTDARRFILD